MELNRRDFIKGAAAATLTGAAGCLDGNENNDTTTTTETTPNNTFNSPNNTTTATKTPEDVANHTNTPTTTTEQTTTPVENTTTPDEWEDLTGEEIYENNLPPGETIIETGTDGEITLQEYTDQVNSEHDLFVDDDLETLRNIGVNAISHVEANQGQHMNQYNFQALEHILHDQYDTDEVRVFQDVTRPRQGGFLDTTIALNDNLYKFAARGQTTEKLAEKAIQPLQQAGAWNPHNNATGNDIDYQNWRNWLQRENVSFDDVQEEGYETFFQGLETGLSYSNEKGWLAPTQDFHAMAGAVHHYAADQEDVEVTRFENMQPEDFNVEDVVRFRDEVNDLKQEYGHDLGEDERIVLDANFQDGDYQLSAEVTEDWDFSDGYADMDN